MNNDITYQLSLSATVESNNTQDKIASVALLNSSLIESYGSSENKDLKVKMNETCCNRVCTVNWKPLHHVA